MSNNSIEYIFTIIDKFSPAFNKMASAMKKSMSSMDKFNKKLKAIGESTKKMGEKFRKVGRGMSLYLTAPLTAMGVLALRNFNQQALAVEQVRVGLESTGGAAARTLEQLTVAAKKMQTETLFGDETILGGVTAQLLTFTNIAGEAFDRTQQVVLDVSTRLAAASGGVADLTSTSIMLGKALNDPVANLGALGRAGIQFSEEQSEQIKTLWKHGHALESQRMILKELETQYGGSAAAAASVGTGGLTQLKNDFMDMLESIGDIIYQGLVPFIKNLGEMIKWLNKLSPVQKKWAVIIATSVAVMGPLIVMVGLLISGFGMLVGVIGTVGLPLFLALGGVIVALGLAIFNIIKYFDALKSGFNDAWATMVGFGLAVKSGFLTAYSWIKNVIDIILKLQSIITSPFRYILNTLKKVEDSILKVQSLAKSPLKLVTSGVDKLKGLFGGKVKSLSENKFEGAMDININAAKGVVKKIVTTKKGHGFRLGTNMAEY